MAIFRPRLPSHVDELLGRAPGERVMAVARDERTEAFIIATTTRLCVLPPDQAPKPGQFRVPVRPIKRAWHEVASGALEPMTSTISVTWVEGGRASQWTLTSGARRFAEVFHDRVAASVIIDAPVQIDGRTFGRVAIRRNLATGEPLRQEVWSGGGRLDPVVLDYAERILDDLAEQAGMV